MAQNNQLLWKSTMTYGAILGLALIIYSVIIVFLDITRFNYLIIMTLIYLPFIIIIIGVVLGTKYYRNIVLQGKISYVTALSVGTSIVFFATIITAFYTYIFNQFIDPAYSEKLFKCIGEKSIQYAREINASTENIKSMTNQFNNSTMPSPVESALGSIPLTTLVGFMISLITSAFIKKDKDPALYK